MNEPKYFQWLALALVAILYLGVGALDKLLAWNQTVAYISQHGYPLPALLTIGAVGVETVAPLALFSSRWRAGALMALGFYTLATAVMFHDFWRADSADHAQAQNFFKNLALTGALLYMCLSEQQRSRAAAT